MEILACIVVENKRKSLLNKVQKYGLSSPKTVKASQQLDSLLNLLQHQSLREEIQVINR